MNTLMKQLTKNIFQLTIPTPFLVGPVNTYVVKGDALTLIDVGPRTEEALFSMKEQLKELNLTINDIENIVLTHHHPDHIGLLHSFLPNAKVFGHWKLNPWLMRDPTFMNHSQKFFMNLYREHHVPDEMIDSITKSNEYFLNYSAEGQVDQILKEGDEIPGLPGWTVLETPGHAQSHISLLSEADRTLIAGDHLIEHISSNAIIEAPYEEGEGRPKTLLQYRKSLQKCKDIHLCYSGHGNVIEDPKKLILSRLKEQENKAFYFKEMLGEEPITCFELCKKVYNRIYKKQPGLTLSETLGHLDYLEAMNEVTVEKNDGIIYYSSH
ncbi:MBL fold metallo-hydrolase [Evansella halocellulosilytica]|uniref:MBL fold metallo-hydrolase n=1 Tax=Evansella halocellulosilytica TaxID=2011013 RepID=UPI000BB6CE11|nr:MBL fold metallo-hydrolase [Evansella halocellulosilytica]